MTIEDRQSKQFRRGIVVTVTDENIALGQELAEARSETYKPINGGQLLADGLDSKDTHLVGVLGEIAVAQHYGVMETVDMDTYQLSDTGGDVCIDGLDVDVKVSRFDGPDPFLLVPSDSTQQHMTAGSADAYFLVQHLGGAEFRLVGFASHGVVTTRAPKRFPRHIKNYVVETDELVNPEEKEITDVISPKESDVRVASNGLPVIEPPEEVA